MTESIQPPAKGQALRADWGRRAAEMLNRHERDIYAGGAPETENSRRRYVKPHPFEVRLVPAGDAEVVAVYVPAGSLTVNGVAVEVDGGEQVEGMEECWQSFSGVEPPEDGSAEVWLNVDFSGEEGPAAEISAAAAASAEEEGEGSPLVQSIKIANLSSGGRRVVQLVRAALQLSTCVNSLNSLIGHVNLVEGEGVTIPVSGDGGEAMDVSIGIEEDASTGEITLSLKTEEDEESDPGYCNAISDDGGGGDTPSNDISNDTAPGEGPGGGSGQPGGPPSNDISQWPCKQEAA